MPAHAIPGKLTVSFWRDGECIDVAIVGNGQLAALSAVLQIEQAAPLQGGDRLTVTYDDGPALPETSRSSHQSG